MSNTQETRADSECDPLIRAMLKGPQAQDTCDLCTSTPKASGVILRRRLHAPNRSYIPMTDGTTGIQVAPITEDDMNKVTSILKRAADAIVGMSQLAADVDMLRTTVASLQADCDKLRNQNNALDEALNHSREMRDNQARELATTKDQLAQAEQDRDRLSQVNISDTATINSLRADLTHAKEEAAQWLDEAHKLTRELDTAHASLDKIKELHTSIFGKAPEAMPVPTPPPAAPSEVPDAPWRSEPSPSSVLPEPTPMQAPVEDTSQDWKPGYNWDHTRQLYVKTA